MQITLNKKEDRFMSRFIMSFAILIFAILVLFSFVAFCDDRYQYLGKSNYNTFYLDITSVVKKYTTLPIFKFWIKNVVSEAGRNSYIATQENYERKNLLQNLSYVLYCDEINLSENTFHEIEILYYSDENFLFRDTLYTGWQNIPPNTLIEFARDVIKRMPQNKFIKGTENEVENDKNNYNYYTYVFISLLAGVAISALLVVFIKKFMLDNNEKNINSSSKAKTENDVIDAILVDENPIFVSKNEVRETIGEHLDEHSSDEYSREIINEHNEHSEKTLLSKITLIEKIILILGVMNISLGLPRLLGFFNFPEYISNQQVLQIIKSSFLMLCAWFSVRYSFHMASQMTEGRFATFIKCIGIFICFLIFWASGKGYI